MRSLKNLEADIVLQPHSMMQYLSPLFFINKSIWFTCQVTNEFWIKSYFPPLSISFPSQRSFPSLSLCQKSTANSKSSSTLVWNTLRTYTSGTPAPRLSAFGLNLVNQVHVQWVLQFQTFWNSSYSVLLYRCSQIADFLPLFPCHNSCKQTNGLFPGYFFPVWQGAFVSLQLAHMKKRNTTIQQSRLVTVPYTVEVKRPY